MSSVIRASGLGVERAVVKVLWPPSRSAIIGRAIPPAAGPGGRLGAGWERFMQRMWVRARILGFRGNSFTELKLDRKSTRLNSSHSQISYAVFCLKKKKNSITYAISNNV